MKTRLRNRLIALLFALGPRLASGQQAHAGHAWSYEKGDRDPKHWGDLDPGFQACKVGRHQSPIDIRGATKANLPSVKFSYEPTAFRIVDDGHNLLVNVDPGNYIVVGGIRYDLVEVQFHHPAEERIEGQRFAMAAHLIHKDLGEHLAVVEVFLNPGRPSPVLDALWKEMPREVGRERRPQGATVDLRKLLPSYRGYYMFSGSLTTPPCTEQVTWVVLKQPMEISRAQENAFATRHAKNARPVQPINGRQIKMSR